MNQIGQTFSEITLVPKPETPQAKTILGHKWAAKDVGYRHKLGGNPQWLQEPEWPTCCGKPMTFYAQLDSVGDQIHLADCGLIYIFVCFDCYNCKSVLQSC